MTKSQPQKKDRINRRPTGVPRKLINPARIPADLAEQLDRVTSKHGEYTRFIEAAIREKLERMSNGN